MAMAMVAIAMAVAMAAGTAIDRQRPIGTRPSRPALRHGAGHRLRRHEGVEKACQADGSAPAANGRPISFNRCLTSR